jgi:hypothetical protein
MPKTSSHNVICPYQSKEVTETTYDTTPGTYFSRTKQVALPLQILPPRLFLVVLFFNFHTEFVNMVTTAKHAKFKDISYYSHSSTLTFIMKIKYTLHVKVQFSWDMTLSSYASTRWFKYDRDKLFLVYTQIVPVIFEPPCSSLCFEGCFKLSGITSPTTQYYIPEDQIFSSITVRALNHARYSHIRFPPQ